MTAIDADTTQLLGLLFESCFDVYIPAPLRNIILEYAAPSCADCRAEFRRLEEAASSTPRTSLVHETNDGVRKNVYTVRQALVKQALDNDVFRGKLLYQPIKNQQVLQQEEEQIFRSERDQDFAQHLLRSLGSYSGASAIVVFNRLHQDYRHLLLRTFPEPAPWIRLFFCSASDAELKKVEALQTSEQVVERACICLQQLTSNHLHRTKSCVDSNLATDNQLLLKAIRGPFVDPAATRLNVVLTGTIKPFKPDPGTTIVERLESLYQRCAAFCQLVDSTPSIFFGDPSNLCEACPLCQESSACRHTDGGRATQQVCERIYAELVVEATKKGLLSDLPEFSPCERDPWTWRLDCANDLHDVVLEAVYAHQPEQKTPTLRGRNKTKQVLDIQRASLHVEQQHFRVPLPRNNSRAMSYVQDSHAFPRLPLGAAPVLLSHSLSKQSSHAAIAFVPARKLSQKERSKGVTR